MPSGALPTPGEPELRALDSENDDDAGSSLRSDSFHRDPDSPNLHGDVDGAGEEEEDGEDDEDDVEDFSFTASDADSAAGSVDLAPSDIEYHHFDALTANPMSFHEFKRPTFQLRFINTLDTTNLGPLWTIFDWLLSVAFACMYVATASLYLKRPMPWAVSFADFMIALVLLLQFLPKLAFAFPADNVLRRLVRPQPLLTLMTTLPALFLRSPLATWDRPLPVYSHWQGYMGDYILFFWPLRFTHLFVSTHKLCNSIDKGSGLFKKVRVSIVQLKLLMLLSGILCTLLTCTSFLHIIEFKYERLRTLSFFDAFFFTYLIATTISYENSLVPDDAFPRIIILSIVFIGLAYVPYAISEVVSALRHRSKFDRPFAPETKQQHVLLLGAVNEVFTLRHFLEEFLSSDHGESVMSTKIVILAPSDPSQKIQRLIRQPHYLHRVQWVRGSSLSHDSYRRVNLDKAVACFILARKYASESRSVDAENVLRAMALVKYCPTLRLYVQSLLPDNKEHFYNFADQVICIDELKLAVLAHSAICPGFSTLLYFLTTSLTFENRRNTSKISASQEKEDQDESDELRSAQRQHSVRSRLSMQRLRLMGDWNDDRANYKSHCESREFARDFQVSHEQAIYPTTLSRAFIGYTFISATDILYREHNILLFGLGIPARLMTSAPSPDRSTRTKSSADQTDQFNIFLNPEDYILKGGEIGFVIARKTEKVRGFRFQTRAPASASVYRTSRPASLNEQTPLLANNLSPPHTHAVKPFTSPYVPDASFSSPQPDTSSGHGRSNTITIPAQDVVEYGETFPSLHARRNTVRDRINAGLAIEKSRREVLSAIPEGPTTVPEADEFVTLDLGLPRIETTPPDISAFSRSRHVRHHSRRPTGEISELTRHIAAVPKPMPRQGLGAMEPSSGESMLPVASSSLPVPASTIRFGPAAPHLRNYMPDLPLSTSPRDASSPPSRPPPPALTLAVHTNTLSDPASVSSPSVIAGNESHQSQHHFYHHQHRRRGSTMQSSIVSPSSPRVHHAPSLTEGSPISPTTANAGPAANPLDSVSDHVLLCGSSDHFPSNLDCFIAPLRASHLSKILPVLIICPVRPSLTQWQTLAAFTDVYYVQGDPLNRNELMLARPHRAARVIVLADDSKVIGAGEKTEDANAVMVVLNLKAVCPPSVFIVVEFVHNETMRFLTEFDAVGEISEESIAYNAPSFLAGNVFTVSMLDSIIAQAYYNPHLVTIMKLLLWTAPPTADNAEEDGDGAQAPMFLAKHSHVFQIPIPSHFVGQQYGSLFSWLIHEFKAVPMGLFRMAKWQLSTNNATSFRYVALSPRADTLIRGGDRVFIFSRNEPETESVHSVATG
ncbi:hypothetical protein RI367_008368 [Sorochytrium milnesiophthora]